MKPGNRFARGSGAYTCNCCGRKTRATGRGDNEHVGLCTECFDLAGYENMILDGETLSANELAEVASLIDVIAQKGGSPQWDYPELLDRKPS